MLVVGDVLVDLLGIYVVGPVLSYIISVRGAVNGLAPRAQVFSERYALANDVQRQTIR
jgi:hypothetical protein